MVTLCHLRRYLAFLDDLVSTAPEPDSILSGEVADLVDTVSDALARFVEARGGLESGVCRKELVDTLGEAGCRYRSRVYRGLSGEGRPVAFADLRRLFASARSLVDRTIEMNRREDGLYHSYNLLSVGDAEIAIDHLDLMLEGQAAVLSSGILSPEESLELLTALRASPLYRADQHSYLLYPDRDLPTFLEKNRVPSAAVGDSRLLQRLLAEGDPTLVTGDIHGGCHFNGAFRNKGDVADALDRLEDSGYAGLVQEEREQVLGLFEAVFRHRSYTGRSGTFFGYEGLGCIYWHMVSKLAVAVQTTIYRARDEGADGEALSRLIAAYQDVRDGLGSSKTPEAYGAFPTDPYSHTPAHAGAKQPGMTGQVKEDILCRWGELGVRVLDGRIVIDPILLRPSELLSEAQTFEYVDLDGRPRTIDLDPGSLAFTCCQTPFIYRPSPSAAIRVVRKDGAVASMEGNTIDREVSAAIFSRSGAIGRVEVDLPPGP
jgi:hypothetical protein